MVESLASMRETLGSTRMIHKPNMVTCASNPRIKEVGTGESGVQGQPQAHAEFGASLLHEILS